MRNLVCLTNLLFFGDVIFVLTKNAEVNVNKCNKIIIRKRTLAENHIVSIV